MEHCKCEVANVVRHINSQIFNGEPSINLDEYANLLTCDGVLEKLNNCLEKHGFSGKVEIVDGYHIIYMRNE